MIAVRFLTMPRYFFDLAGDVPAHDLIGQDCPDHSGAREHGADLAHRIGIDKPELVHKGNFISIRDEGGNRLFQIPLASTHG